jgi:hypothetical protein
MISAIPNAVGKTKDGKHNIHEGEMQEFLKGG